VEPAGIFSDNQSLWVCSPDKLKAVELTMFVPATQILILLIW